MIALTSHRSALIAVALCCAVITGCRATSKVKGDQRALADPMDELRALFVTTAFNTDWPSRQGLHPNVQRNEINAILDNALAQNCNAIFLQVRALGDRLHTQVEAPYPNPNPDPELFPHVKEHWSLAVNYSAEPGYVPLDEWIHRAHERGLAIYAWVNLYRTDWPLQRRDPATGQTSYLPFWVSSDGQHLQLDPTHPHVEEYLLAVIDNLIAYRTGPTGPFMTKIAWAQAGGSEEDGNMAATTQPPGDDGIDGVVIDHYFPDPDNPGPIVSGAFAENLKVAGKSRASVKKTVKTKTYKPDPRIEHFKNGNFGYTTTPHDKDKLAANDMVKKIHEKTKAAKLLFGISVSKDQWAHRHADAKLWLESGWCDYFIPNLYYRAAEEGSTEDGDFELAYQAWNGVTHPASTRIIPGLMSGAVEVPYEGAQWTAKELRRQVAYVRSKQEAATVYKGHAHYPARALRPPELGGPPPPDYDIGKELNDNEYKTPAEPPPTTTTKPPKVKLTDGATAVSVKTNEKDVLKWRVRFSKSGNWGDWKSVNGKRADIKKERGANLIEVVLVNKRHERSDPEQINIKPLP